MLGGEVYSQQNFLVGRQIDRTAAAGSGEETSIDSDVSMLWALLGPQFERDDAYRERWRDLEDRRTHPPTGQHPLVWGRAIRVEQFQLLVCLAHDRGLIAPMPKARDKAAWEAFEEESRAEAPLEA